MPRPSANNETSFIASSIFEDDNDGKGEEEEGYDEFMPFASSLDLVIPSVDCAASYTPASNQSSSSLFLGGDLRICSPVVGSINGGPRTLLSRLSIELGSYQDTPREAIPTLTSIVPLVVDP